MDSGIESGSESEVVSGVWRMEWRVEDGEGTVENAVWRLESGEWRVERREGEKGVSLSCVLRIMSCLTSFIYANYANHVSCVCIRVRGLLPGFCKP